MNKWLLEIRKKENKRVAPIVTFPAIQYMNISVKDLVSNSDKQVEAFKIVKERINPLCIMGIMDLSVEAEAFGSKISFSDDEVPNVIGSIVKNNEDADNLKIPNLVDNRTKIFIEGIKKAKQEITDIPVFAGCIGPFSLAGRLLDVSEAMILCYEDPQMVHTVLEKVTTFIIQYIKAYKDIGADGVVMAEPLAGILSPQLCEEFSGDYVKRIISELDDDNFTIIYHNCGNNTVKMVDVLKNTGCKVFHFGNAIDIKEMIDKMGDDVIVMGNIDPVHIKDNSKLDVENETKELLEQVGSYENFIISSGCDIPPLSSWENIETFANISNDYYQK